MLLQRRVLTSEEKAQVRVHFQMQQLDWVYLTKLD